MGRHPSRRHASPDAEPIGRRVRRRRRELDLTQEALAGKEYTKSFISQLEAGHADPSLDTLRFLGRRLQTSLSSMAGDAADVRLAAVEGALAWAHDAARARDVAAARRAIEVAVEIAAASGWDLHRAEALLLQAEVEIEAGTPDHAAAALERASEVASRLGPRFAARAALSRGLLALRSGDAAAAAAAFGQALERARSAARHRDLAVRALLGLAAAAARTADLRRARRRLASAERLASRHHLTELLGRAQVRLGLLSLREGDEDAARQHLEAACRTLEVSDDLPARLEADLALARFWVTRGSAADALPAADRAAAHATAIGAAIGAAVGNAVAARAQALRGRALLLAGMIDEAIPSLTSAVELLAGAGPSLELAEAAAALGDYHRAQGEETAAARYLGIVSQAGQGPTDQPSPWTDLPP